MTRDINRDRDMSQWWVSLSKPKNPTYILNSKSRCFRTHEASIDRGEKKQTNEQLQLDLTSSS